MRVFLCYSVFFLRLFYLCTAKAVDLGLIYNRQARTVSPSALIECTPANCIVDSECSWKYCPITGHVPKCVEGNYTSKCCACADEWPDIRSMMMSSSEELLPIRSKKSNQDKLGVPPTRICHQLFKSRTDKLTQLYQKIANKRIKNMGIKKKSYLESEIKKLHSKKMRLYIMGRNYDFLTTPSDSDATKDDVNDYISRNIKTNVHKNTDGDAIRSKDSNVLINSNNHMKDYKAHLGSTNDTKSEKTRAVTMKKYVVESNTTLSNASEARTNHGPSSEVMHHENKEPKDDDGDKKQVIKGDIQILEKEGYINEPKVIMGDKLVG